MKSVAFTVVGCPFTFCLGFVNALYTDTVLKLVDVAVAPWLLLTEQDLQRSYLL